jgi:isoleucyl-tRNA synthetase
MAKPNFRILGKKVGKLMNATQAEVQKLSLQLLKKLLAGHTVEITVEGETIVLTPEDVAVERKVNPGVIASSEGDLTVALDTQLTDDLILEGIARELVNKINSLRRELDFAVTDRIDVKIQTDSQALLGVRKAFEAHRGYICHETLTISFEFTSVSGEVLDINGHEAVIALQRVIHTPNPH